jgi:hypothetical protein
VIRWVDITQLEKNATLLLPDMIKVSTRSSEHFFSVFLNINETFKLMEQLANIAMRQLLDNEGFEQDRSLPKLKKKSPKKVSALKRWVREPLELRDGKAFNSPGALSSGQLPAHERFPECRYNRERLPEACQVSERNRHDHFLHHVVRSLLVLRTECSGFTLTSGDLSGAALSWGHGL